MDPLSALIIGGMMLTGTIISSVVSAKGQKEANKANIRQQQQNNETSIELANTAHQREVEDLKKAGLNPVLSVSGTGATTPTLGTATIQNEYSGVAEAINGSANAFANIMTAKAQNKTANAQNKTANAQAELNHEQAEAVDSQKRLNNAQAEFQEKQVEYYEDHGVFPGATTTRQSSGGALGFNSSSSETIPVGLKHGTPGTAKGVKSATDQRKNREKNDKLINKHEEEKKKKGGWWY